MTALPEKLSWVCPGGVTPLHGGVMLCLQECLSYRLRKIAASLNLDSFSLLEARSSAPSRGQSAGLVDPDGLVILSARFTDFRISSLSQLP